MNKKILIISIILITLGAGGFLVYKKFCPKEIYKGVNMPTLTAVPYGDMWKPTLMDLDRAAADGVNTLSFGPGFLVNKEGNIGLIGTKEFLISFIDEAHAKGFKIRLVPGIVYSEKPVDFSKEPKGSSPIPAEVIENTDVMQNLDLAVIEWAKIAQEHKIEIFSPVGEAHFVLGIKEMRNWLPKIKPQIEAVYKGKICLAGEWEWDFPELSSYSCFASSAIEIPRNEVEEKEVVNTVNRWVEEAKERNIELMIGEIWYGPNWTGTAEDAQRGFAAVFEAVRGKVTGVFVLDAPHFPPPWDKLMAPVHIEDFESVLKEFYTSELE